MSIPLLLSREPPVGATFFVGSNGLVIRVKVFFPPGPWSVVSLGSERHDRDQLVKVARDFLLPWAEGWLHGKSLPLPLPFSRLITTIQSGLVGIDPGMTISYSDFARRCGMPQAVRHAAHLLSQNPIPLLVPCHRVVAKSGQIGGYLAGIPAKASLLSFEKQF